MTPGGYATSCAGGNEPEASILLLLPDNDWAELDTSAFGGYSGAAGLMEVEGGGGSQGDIIKGGGKEV